MKPAISHPIRRHQVIEAVGPSRWDLINEILYKLCGDYPNHRDPHAIVAKMQIIGRVYAASIERRRNKKARETADSFYFSRVAPSILKSDIDKWIGEAKEADPESEASIAVMLKIHKRTMDLFSRISGQNKRSLASKYLHFHVPDLFLIYDSRASKAIRSLRLIRHSRLAPQFSDSEYRSFVARCISLRKFCKIEFGLHLSPRKLDNLLLDITR